MTFSCFCHVFVVQVRREWFLCHWNELCSFNWDSFNWFKDGDWCAMSVKLLMDWSVGCLHYFQVIVYDVFWECFCMTILHQWDPFSWSGPQTHRPIILFIVIDICIHMWACVDARSVVMWSFASACVSSRNPSFRHVFRSAGSWALMDSSSCLFISSRH